MSQMEIIQRPLVSVGIPTYNRAAGLRRTLQFICQQTYPNLEIIVSDNASPGPETEAVVREIADVDPRVRYFRQATNKKAKQNNNNKQTKTTNKKNKKTADDDERNERFI